MIKLRIEFLTELEHQCMLNAINKDFDIVECEPIKNSKLPGNKLKLQYLTVVMKQECIKNE